MSHSINHINSGAGITVKPLRENNTFTLYNTCSLNTFYRIGNISPAKLRSNRSTVSYFL